MAGDTDNVRIWEGADVFTAPLGTDAPTAIDTDWPVEWEVLGSVHEDGFTFSREQDTADHHDYNGALVRTTKRRHKKSFTFTPLENTPVVFDLVNPGSEAETTGGVTTRTVKTPTTNIRAFGLELRDGDITRRLVIPRGEVVEAGDEPITPEDMNSRELTVNIYPDGDGVHYLEITDDPAAEVVGS